MKACALCGCTEARACPGGCAWGRPWGRDGRFLICTACEQIADELIVPLHEVVHGPQSPPGATLLQWLCLFHDGPRVRLDRWAHLENKAPAAAAPQLLADAVAILRDGMITGGLECVCPPDAKAHEPACIRGRAARFLWVVLRPGAVDQFVAELVGRGRSAALDRMEFCSITPTPIPAEPQPPENTSPAAAVSDGSKSDPFQPPAGRAARMGAALGIEPAASYTLEQIAESFRHPAEVLGALEFALELLREGRLGDARGGR